MILLMFILRLAKLFIRQIKMTYSCNKRLKGNTTVFMFVLIDRFYKHNTYLLCTLFTNLISFAIFQNTYL